MSEGAPAEQLGGNPTNVITSIASLLPVSALACRSLCGTEFVWERQRRGPTFIPPIRHIKIELRFYCDGVKTTGPDFFIPLLTHVHESNMSITIRKVQYDSFGPPELLYIARTSIPSLASGSVLVKVHGASIGGGESAIREGKLAIFMGRKFPAAVGVDFSGVVEAVAPGPVGIWKPGDRVWGVMPHGTFGALADFVAVPESRLSRVPHNLGLIEAAALPAAGTTVIRALSKEANLQKGERILIRGGAGGVGSAAVQYARSLGGQVVVLASSGTFAWLRQLGANEVVDYRSVSLQSLGSFDVILDVVGTNMSTLRQMLSPGGRMVELGFDSERPLRSMLYMLSTQCLGSRRIRAFSNNPSSSELSQLSALVEDGVIKPFVDRVWDMEQVVDAVKAVERGGVRGKHVLQLA